MRYKIWVKNGHAHLWSYDRFREEVHGRLIDWKLDQNTILFIIIEVDCPIPAEKFSKYKFEYRILDEKEVKSNA